MTDIDSMVIARDAAITKLKEHNKPTDKQIMAYGAGFNAGWLTHGDIMSTFNQITEMQKLVQTLARMDTPYDNMHPQASDDDREAVAAELDDERLCSDAGALYALIEDARAILKGGRP